MNRMLSLISLLLFCACQNPYELTRNPSDHFVVIYIGTESRTPMDPIDKNVFLLETAKVYEEFRKRGVPKENIYVLYYDSEIDWASELQSEFSEDFKQEFKQNYFNTASVKNLLKIEDLVDDSLKSNSVLHLVLNAHGRVDASGFYMHSELDNRLIRAELLNDMLSDNRGITHLYVGSCYSGKLKDEIEEGKGVLVMGANEKGSCWLDRENSFGRIYFSNLPNDLEPEKYQQSFEVSRKLYIQWGRERSDFIFNTYKTNKKSELKTLVWDPLIKKF